MVRPPTFDTNGMKKGAWSEDEDAKLSAHVLKYGHRNWRLVPIFAGLARGGKSCRLRWVNYLKPGIKRGNFTKEEEDLIIELHAKHGSKWSTIAANFDGRTDNEIKNHWHAHLKKRCGSNHKADAIAAKRRPSNPNSCITKTSDDHHPQMEAAGLISAKNPENILANVNTAGQAYQPGDLSWAAATTNYQSFYNPPVHHVHDALPFANPELDNYLGLVYQELMLNDESNCSDYSSTTTGITSSAESQGSFGCNPYQDLLDASSYDDLLWG